LKELNAARRMEGTDKWRIADVTFMDNAVRAKAEIGDA
jgi:hypothetical protein